MVARVMWIGLAVAVLAVVGGVAYFAWPRVVGTAIGLWMSRQKPRLPTNKLNALELLERLEEEAGKTGKYPRDAAIALSMRAPYEPLPRGRAEPTLRKMQGDTDPSVRVEATWLLWWLQAITDDEAAKALGAEATASKGQFGTGKLDQMGPAAAAAVPSLAKVVKEAGPLEYHAAVTALGKIGPAAEAAVPALLDRLNGLRGDQKIGIVRTLGSIGPAASQAASPLAQLLAEPANARDMNLARTIGISLSRIGPAAVPPLADLLPAPDAAAGEGQQVVWLRALEALAAIGRPAGVARSKAAALLRWPDRAVQIAAATALGRFGPADADDEKKALEAALVGILDSKDPAIVEKAAEAVGLTGATDETVGRLKALLDDKEARVRAAAGVALSRARPGENGERLAALLRDKAARYKAVQAAMDLGPAAAPALPALQEMLIDPKQYNDLRKSAAQAIGNIGPPARSSLPALIALRDELAAKAAAQGSAELRCVVATTAARLDSAHTGNALEVLTTALDNRFMGYGLPKTAAEQAALLGRAASSLVPALRRARSTHGDELRIAVDQALLAVSPVADR